MAALTKEQIETVKLTAGKLKCIGEAIERFAVCESTGSGTVNCAEKLATDIVACVTH